MDRPYKLINEVLSTKIARISFICAMLVVAIHCTYKIDNPSELPWFFSWVQTYINVGVTRIAVPLFFVIFGFLLCRDYDYTVVWWIRKLKSRAKNLAVPYLTWAIIGIGLLVGFNIVRKDAIVLDFKSVKFWSDALGLTAPPTGMIVLWFVRECLIFVFFASVFARFIERVGVGAFAVLSLLGICFHNNMALDFAWISLGVSFAFDKSRMLDRVLQNSKSLYVSGIAWGVLCFIRSVAVQCQWQVTNGGGDMLISLCMNLSGIVFVWVGYDGIAHLRVLKIIDKVAKSSFVIYMTHTIFMIFVQYPLLKSAFPAHCPFLYCGISYLATLALSITFYFVIKTRMPRFVLMLLSGGR